MRGQVKVYQKKIVARRRRRVLFISLYSALALGLVFSGLSYLSHLDALTIKKIVVEGNNRTDTASIENRVLESISGNYFRFFSRSNSLLYPKDEVREGILGFPAIRDAEVSRRGLGAVAIALSERREAAVWCDHECYSLDESGFIFAPRPLSASSTDVMYRGAITGDPIGQSYLSPEKFKKISFFIKQLGGLSIEPREVSLSETGYMTVVLREGGRIMLDSDDELSIVLSNIAAVVTDKTVAPDFFEFLEHLDYIKIDSGNKAVFRMKASE